MKILSLLFIILMIIQLLNCTPGDSEGARLYQLNCANCHMEDGQGLKGLIPPLTDTKFLTENRSKLPCWIKHGVNESMVIDGKDYIGEMPGVPTLTDVQIANIINYIQQEWHQNLDFYSENEVQESLKECQ